MILCHSNELSQFSNTVKSQSYQSFNCLTGIKTVSFVSIWKPVAPKSLSVYSVVNQKRKMAKNKKKGKAKSKDKSKSKEKGEKKKVEKVDAESKASSKKKKKDNDKKSTSKDNKSTKDKIDKSPKKEKGSKKDKKSKSKKDKGSVPPPPTVSPEKKKLRPTENCLPIKLCENLLTEPDSEFITIQVIVECPCDEKEPEERKDQDDGQLAKYLIRIFEPVQCVDAPNDAWKPECCKFLKGTSEIKKRVTKEDLERIQAQLLAEAQLAKEKELEEAQLEPSDGIRKTKLLSRSEMKKRKSTKAAGPMPPESDAVAFVGEGEEYVGEGGSENFWSILDQQIRRSKFFHAEPTTLCETLLNELSNDLITLSAYLECPVGPIIGHKELKIPKPEELPWFGNVIATAHKRRPSFVLSPKEKYLQVRPEKTKKYEMIEDVEEEANSLVLVEGEGGEGSNVQSQSEIRKDSKTDGSSSADVKVEGSQEIMPLQDNLDDSKVIVKNQEEEFAGESETEDFAKNLLQSWEEYVGESGQDFGRNLLLRNWKEYAGEGRPTVDGNVPELIPVSDEVSVPQSADLAPAPKDAPPEKVEPKPVKKLGPLELSLPITLYKILLSELSAEESVTIPIELECPIEKVIETDEPAKEEKLGS